MTERELTIALSNIEGWLLSSEAWALHNRALQVIATMKGADLVEIGSWKGRSTIAIALAIPPTSSERLYAIDPHTGSREHQVGPDAVDTYSEFIANLKRAGVEDRVVALRETSLTARPRFDDHSVGLLFVDGSHEYIDVKNDIAAWRTALVDGALVAFNDAGWPGVNRALREAMCRRHSPFREPHMVGNTLICTFHQSSAWSLTDAMNARRLWMFLMVRAWGARNRRYLPSRLIPTFRHLINLPLR
jgi:predicted O-methyltransferase YrrM